MYISHRLSLRHDRYAFHACRNLPDKELCNPRTVIVTATIHWFALSSSHNSLNLLKLSFLEGIFSWIHRDKISIQERIRSASYPDVSYGHRSFLSIVRDSQREVSHIIYLRSSIHRLPIHILTVHMPLKRRKHGLEDLLYI